MRAESAWKEDEHWPAVFEELLYIRMSSSQTLSHLCGFIQSLRKRKYSCAVFLALLIFAAAPVRSFAASADVLIDMTVQPNPVIAGANVTYHITASNNGPDDSTNVTVTDALPSGLSFVSSTPSQGTCSGTTTITCAFGAIATYSNATIDIVAQTTAPGTINNTASVTATEPDPDATNNSVTKAVTANVGADMSIGISGAPASAAQGATLTYTITASNAGPSPATNVTISDPLPSGSTFVSATGTGWNCANSSGTVTCSRSSSSAVGALPNITLKVTPTATGTVTNAVSITATENDPNSNNNTATTSNTVTPGADLAITQPTPTSPVAVGATITYSLTVRNNGPGAASLINVNDTLPANVAFNSVSGSGWSCSQTSGTVACSIAGPISSGASAGVITISTTAASPGSAVNTATVSSTDSTTTDPTSSNNTASTTVTIQTPGADLSLPTMSVSPNPVAVGSNVTFSMTGKNNGPLATSGVVTLTDTLPSSLTFVSASGSGWSCSNSSGTVTCTTSSVVNSGSNMNAITLVATATGSGSISNSACVYAASPSDPNTGNNCYSGSGGTVTSTSASADLAITQAAPSPNPVVAGMPLTYSFTVTNNGPNDATNVVVKDTVYNASSATGTTSQGTCTGGAPYPSCNLGTLTNGASATVTIQIVPTASGSRTNQGTVSSADIGDPIQANNSSNTVTSTVSPGVDVALTHTATPEPVLAGTNLTYVLTARNNGPSTATNVTITDTLPAGVTYSSASPSSGSCSQSALVVTCNLGSIGSGSQGTVTVVVVPNNTGSITASASVTSTETDINTANNSANFTSTVNQAQVDVQVTKYGSPNPVAFGGNVTYTITVHNSGPSIATGVVATDTPMTQFTFVSVSTTQGTCSGTATVTCNLGTIANNGNAVITMVMTASQVGTYDNIVSVTSNETDTNTANNTADERSTSQLGADLAVTESAAPNPVFKDGTLTYTSVITNNGPVSSPSTTLTDVLPSGVTLVSATATQGSCTGTTTLTCNVGTLNTGGSATVTVTVTPTAAGSLVNPVSVTGGEPDPNSANNSASATSTVDPIADMTVTKTHSGNFTVGQSNATYTITASNSGGAATTAAVTVTDTVPTGLTPVSASGTGWNCTIAGQTVTCTRSDVLGATTAYAGIAVAVNVAANAPSSVTNTATVSGGGEIKTSNDTATDTTTINQVADLTLTMTSAGSFIRTAAATYTLTANNAGLAATAGTVTVADPFPVGVTPGSATGAGWSCTTAGQSVSCTRSSALGIGASYPAISIPVTFASDAPASVTNTATVAGGGEINTANDSTSVTSTIATLPDMTVGVTTTGTAVQAGSVTYALTANNIGGSVTTTSVTVTDSFPAGLSPSSATGSGWSCTVTGQAVSCNRSDALASGASYPAISVPVDIAATAPATIVDTATVGGGGEANTANDSAGNTLAVTQLPDMTISLSTTGTFAQGGNGSYVLTASNAGAVSSNGTVTVTDTFPAGVTPSAASGSGWSCVVAGQAVTCTRADVVSSGASFSAITVNVGIASNAPATLSNTATVAGGGEANTANDTATLSSPIVAASDMTVTLSGSGTFAQGANASYIIGSSNIGGASTSGTVTISDVFPAGLTPTAATGTGWNCPTPVAQTVTCTNTNALAASASYGNITVAVRIATTAAASISDTATVAGGAENNLANDTATSTVTIGGVADMTVTLTANGSFTQGLPGSLTVGSSNVGGMASSGTVTITSSLPTGLTPSTATGTGWTCAVVAQTVTCTRADALSPGGSYSPITVNVTAANNAPASVSDTATISGGNETNLSNDTATQAIAIGAAADLTVSLTANGTFGQGSSASYTIGSSNVGGAATSGTVTVTDALPPSLTPTGASGNGWTCTISGQTVACTRADSLSPGTAYPAIAVPVAISATAPLSLSDTATVSGGADVNPTNNSATVSTSVSPAPDLTLTMTNSGHFSQGGSASFTLTANNAGGIPTNAPVTVTDSLPPGLTPAVATGSGWRCNIAGQSVTCTRLDALAIASNYPPIAIGLTVAPNAAFTVTNNASVSGGGETNTANDSASNVVTVNGIPDLTVSLSNSGTFVQGGTAAYAITASNIGGVSTNGPATVVDTLPIGITPVTAAGSGWICSIAGQSTTCTRADVLTAGASYPAISLSVKVASNASGSLANNVTISGGGEQNLSNDMAQSAATVATKPDLSLSSTQTGAFTQGSQATYQLNINNVGPATTDGTTVKVTDTVPAGLTPVSAAGTNWTCAISGQTVTCTRTDALMSGAAYPAISLNVNVAGASGTSVTNNASVSGGGDINLANNASSQTASIQPKVYPDLTVALSHAGDFTQGMTGQYSLVVSNIGQAATNGDVSVTDVLPPGLSATKAAGSGWNCSVSAQVVNCDRADPLSAAGQYSPIALLVRVAPDSPMQLQDTATVAGGSEQNLSNDTGSDTTHIIIPPLPQLTISESADRTSVQMGDVVTYTMLVTDTSAVSAEQVELDSQVPAGFQYVKGTARVQAGSGTALSEEPQLHGSALVFQLGHMPAHGLITVSYRARVGANVRTGSYRDTASVSGLAPTGQHVGPAAAQVAVNIGQSLMEVQRAALGRVYVDANGNNVFDIGDSAVPGVRLYLSDGQSVITDSEGLYSFPSLPEGSVAMSIDPVTMPSGYALSSEGERQGESFTRLLRTPLGTGTVVRQNFALRAIPGMPQASLVAPAEGKTKSKPYTQKTQNVDEPIEPVTPGEFVLVKPVANAPLTSADAEIVARVAAGWHVAVAVNGRPLDTSKATSNPHKPTHTTTFTLHTTDLVPGPNKLRVTAIGPSGEKGASSEIAIHRSGPAQRLEIASDKRDVTADGRDETTLRVRAYDAWGKPAADGPLTLETSRGELRLVGLSSGREDLAQTAARARAKTGLTPVAAAAGMNPMAAPIALDLHSIGSGASSGAANNLFNSTGNAYAAPGSANAANSSVLSRAIDGAASAMTDTPANRNAGGAPAEQIGENFRQQMIPLHNGEAVLQLKSAYTPGSAEIVATTGAQAQRVEGRTYIGMVPELRTPILVGVGELSFGHSAPEVGLFNENVSVERRAQFFYRSTVAGNNVMTLAYSSQSPLNRTNGYDRMFDLDPTNQQYLLFGDSSTRFYNAQSNSRLYARIDHGLSYLMFGDLRADAAQPAVDTSLTSFERSITGIKLHLEDHTGSSLTLTGARPDTAYARDIFPGNTLGLITLSHQNVLPGSEVITLETRDRRNPAIVLTRETLIRSVDYTMDATSGAIFFLRSISALDSALNLTQVVINYEYQSVGLSSAVYTARAEKRMDRLGLRFGVSFLNDRQGGDTSYMLAGIEAEKKLPHNGFLNLEVPVSHGSIAASGTAFTATDTGNHDGTAVRAELEAPLDTKNGLIRGSFSKTDANFLNPFGSTIIPGAQTAAGSFDFKPLAASRLHFGLTDERNKTVNVDNRRSTLSASWKQTVTERIDLTAGYDFRNFDDRLSDRVINSNLLTVGADWRITNKLQSSIQREQNVGIADPTYPSETVLSAKYQVSPETKLFYTQRLSAAPIIPIGDVSASGFASLNTRSEMSLGMETRLQRYTSLGSRYEIENGINGTDSYAVLGLVNRFPVSKHLSLDLGAEHGVRISGKDHDFNSGTAAVSWLPNKFFRATSRYELRDQFGFGSLASAGAAGRISSGVTALGLLQIVRSNTNGQHNALNRAIAALAIRPLKSDRAGLLFSYNHQNGSGYSLLDGSSLPASVGILSTDAWWQAAKRLEFYDRLAFSDRTSSAVNAPGISTLTYMWQQRMQYRFGKYFDAAGEARWLWQPVTATSRQTAATEIGGWLLRDIRLAIGYSFESAPEIAPDFLTNAVRRGIYFNITGKFSRMFDLFGTPGEQALTGQVAPAKKP